MPCFIALDLQPTLKLVILLRKLNAPATDGSLELKWEVALVAEVEFEHARVVLTVRRGDGFSGRVLYNYPWVIGQYLIAILHLVITAAGGCRWHQTRLY